MTAYFHKEEMNDTEVKSQEEKEMYQKVANLTGKLIVSCQALPNEPLQQRKAEREESVRIQKKILKRFGQKWIFQSLVL